ncbi:MAG: DUF4381 domain-containing protein [Gammaproteobacteria bacterium]|nr:DUF4381 domain-containing protein [Gammaproteobacteria bacterium]
MNPQDPLAALQPLREPAALHWWPPAPGWWLLALLVLGLLALLVYRIASRWRASRYRRQGLQQLEEHRAAYDEHGDPTRFVAQINAVLKSVALCAYPRGDVSRQHGATWIEFLNTQLPHNANDHRFPPHCFEGVYQREAGAQDTAQLLRCARYWIRHHRSAP